MNGIIVVNKSDGMTSHDVVQKVRRRFGIKKVGHAGTLDPMATGVLIMLLGKSTKLFDRFMAFDKAYRATLVLGTKTATADTQGEVTSQRPFDAVTEEKLVEAFKQFEGEIDQVPPMYSAVKVNGRKLYELAREGKVIERDPRRVVIKELKIEEINFPHVKFYMECSKGTYVRQLAEDIGEVLGCGACISQIERTKIGKYSIKDSVRIEDLDESHLQCFEG